VVETPWFRGVFPGEYDFEWELPVRSGWYDTRQGKLGMRLWWDGLGWKVSSKSPDHNRLHACREWRGLDKPFGKKSM
jgi:hypothetical protein